MRGRRPEFDRQQALNAAMEVFWRKGYGNASLTDLTSAMGINKPSMYAAFGNKEALLIEALEHYAENYAKPIGALLADESVPANERLYQFVLANVANQTSPELPGGCLVASCSSESGGETIPRNAHEALENARNASAHLLESFFSEVQVQGQLDAAASAGVLATYVLTLLHGCASMARAGTSREELEQVIRMSLAGLGFRATRNP